MKAFIYNFFTLIFLFLNFRRLLITAHSRDTSDGLNLLNPPQRHARLITWSAH